MCLSGLTRNSKGFHRLAGRLATTRRVLCPDYRGRGYSAHDPNWRNYVPTTYVNDIRHLLVVAGVDRVVIVGTSLGGILGMGLAAAMPVKIAGVVLNDIGPEVDSEGMDQIVDYLRMAAPQPDWQSAARQICARRHWLSPDGSEEMARNSYREREDGMLHPDWDANLLKALARERGDPPELWTLFGALRRIPTLAVRGALSNVLNPRTFERMAAEKPDLARVTVDGVGHAPTLDEAEAKQAIDEFLSDL